jgi:iron(III) transport system ATP-binding protein
VHWPARIAPLMEAVGLSAVEGLWPSALSGGMAQRVALVRALAVHPAALLLDEPFANVDAERRNALGAQLRSTVRAEGTAALLVTHDRADALRLADRVVAVVPGADGATIAQVGPPTQLYHRPSSEAVARLTGPATFLDGVAGGHSAQTALGTVSLAEPRQGPVRLLLRPEQLRFDPDGDQPILERGFLGRGWLLTMQTPAGPLSAEVDALPSGSSGTLRVHGSLWAMPS